MGFPAQTKDGETIIIVKKEALYGEKELFTAEDGRIFTRSMDAQALQLVEVDESEDLAAPAAPEAEGAAEGSEEPKPEAAINVLDF